MVLDELFEVGEQSHSREFGLGFCAGIGQGPAWIGLPGEAGGSRLKNRAGGLVPPTPVLEPFILQALTVLGTTPVESP
jgi:hypothetical protein